MLKVYRSWYISPLSKDVMIAQKGRMTLRGKDFEDLVVQIDRHEYREAERERVRVASGASEASRAELEWERRLP